MRFNVREFNHSSEHKSFTAEASNLRRDLDYTITLETDLGTEATFVLRSTKRDGEGDILAWDYIPAIRSVVANPRLEGYSLTVFND